MQTGSDPYAELGVPRDATQTEITHAFRRLVRLHHPDSRPLDDTTSAEDSASTLRRVIAAYAALSKEHRPPNGSLTQSRQVPSHSRVSASAADDSIRAGPIRWSRMG
jgi:preprotein translocase subunit Sec63